MADRAVGGSVPIQGGPPLSEGTHSLPGRTLGSGGWPTVRFAAELVALCGASLGAILGMVGPGVGARDRWLAIVYPLVVLGVMRARGARSARLDAILVDQVAHVVGACSLAAMSTIATGSLFGAERPAATVVRLWVLTVVALGAARVVLLWIERCARRSGALARPTLIVGAGVVGHQIARRLRDRPEHGLRPVGFLDANPPHVDGGAGVGVPVLGGPDDLAAVVRTSGARHVILAFAAERDHRLVGLVERCQELGLQVSIVPRLYESINHRARLDHLGGLPLLGLQAVDTRGWRFAIKHALDRVGAALALLLLSPLLFAIAVAVRLSSPGPVLFRQRRVGRDGQEFEIFKFRSMLEQPAGERFAPAQGVAPGGVEGVDRRTQIGRWLRSTSVDELPQLLNVVRGEMSLVGPRPERPEFAERFGREVHRYDDRHRVRAGITGWAQANGLRGQTSIADRVEFDNHYIQNWSLGLELRTLALSVAEVMRFRADQPPTARPDLRLVDVGSEATLAPADALPDPSPGHDDAFLMIDSRLTVKAISSGARRVLGIEDGDAIDRPIVDLLAPADAQAPGFEDLAGVITRAAHEDREVSGTFVCPRNVYGVRLHARIARRGPRDETVVILEPAARQSSLATTPPGQALAKPA